MLAHGISSSVPTVFRVSETAHLQDLIDEANESYYIPDGVSSDFNQNRFSGGAVVQLQKGVYDCDITIHNPGLTIIGEGMLQTEIRGSVTVWAPFTHLYGMAIRGVNRAYGLKVQRNPAPGYGNISRCRFEDLIVGGSYWSPSHPQDAGAPGAPIDGPTDGIVIDGAYLTDFKHVTSAFCVRDALHIEALDGDYPSTTLGFTDCTFNKSGRHGVYAKGPLNGFHMLRGNVEQNGNYIVRGPSSDQWNVNPDGSEGSEMRLESVTNIHLQSVDFEGDIPFDSVILAVTSNTGRIEGCSFFYNALWNTNKPRPLRFFGAATCNAIQVRGNRSEGFGNGRIAQFDDRCTDCGFGDHGYAGSFAATQHVKALATGHPWYNSYR